MLVDLDWVDFDLGVPVPPYCPAVQPLLPNPHPHWQKWVGSEKLQIQDTSRWYTLLFKLNMYSFDFTYLYHTLINRINKSSRIIHSGRPVDPLRAEAGHADPREEHDKDALLQESLLGPRLGVRVSGGAGVIAEKVPEGGACQLRAGNISL